MRARNIKPGFFKNEQLAECSPIARLLFIGLWCLADREGRLEYRPRRFRAEIMPYEDNIDIVALIQELYDKNFLLLYPTNNPQYIQIHNFKKHQHCHIKEQPSTIPAPDKHQTSPVQERPLIESPLPITECLLPEAGSALPVDNSTNGNAKDAFLKKIQSVVSKIRVKFPDPYFNQDVLLFIQSNTRRNPDAIIHCLESILKAPGPIIKPKAYLEAAMKVEDGKFNAAESERISDEHKTAPINLGAIIGSIGKPI